MQSETWSDLQQWSEARLFHARAPSLAPRDILNSSEARQANHCHEMTTIESNRSPRYPSL